MSSNYILRLINGSIPRLRKSYTIRVDGRCDSRFKDNVFLRNLKSKSWSIVIADQTPIDSTMNVIDFPLKSKTAVIALEQQKGKGRKKESQWQSPIGSLSLTISDLYRQGDGSPFAYPKNLPALQLMCGLVVYEAICQVSKGMDGKITLKWPNDVLLAGKKVAGVLSTAEVIGAQCQVSIGIGMNVLNTFTDEKNIGKQAASLCEHVQCSLDLIERICAELLNSYDRWSVKVESERSMGSIMRDFERKWTYSKNDRVKIIDETNNGISGRVIGLDGIGRLKVLTSAGSDLIDNLEILVDAEKYTTLKEGDVTTLLKHRRNF
ncbi:hypothetical protein ACOME3_009287 [Neoechinorhynchus agilis]